MYQHQRIAIFGATGSIGLSTLDVIAQEPERFSLYAISGYTNLKQLAQITSQYQPQVVHLMHQDDESVFMDYLDQLTSSAQGFQKPDLRFGQEGLCETASSPDVDAVMAAIVGIAGLASTYTAIASGKTVYLANKESLVVAGELMIQKARETGATILPVDSEHNAIFQCLQDAHHTDVKSLILTASGGPFRDYDLDELRHVTLSQALKHPNWAMGAKVTIDSATMANKGLEVIEAHYLFNQPADQIHVLIHPQSVVHSMVHYKDGSVMAQLGASDMRLSISHCLYYPHRSQHDFTGFDPLTLSQLEFKEVDLSMYPCYRLAREVLNDSQSACIVFNAANEIAVERFQKGVCAFVDIASQIDDVLQSMDYLRHLTSLDDVISLDVDVRRFMEGSLI
ncbi:MAG: 1-deoxy-D-xylulose-5-phosphate reductoisomerase [Alcaligenaceae bacterium]|nr:1-deoxy-D-xylulose-5-phosphate reductoisomerase [Alcaligenaceae bacterium]